MATARRSGLGENISSYGDGTRDYTSLATWEAATDVNLVSATTTEILEVYADSASFDDGNVNFGGATTSSDYFRILRGHESARPNGVPGSGACFNKIGNAGNILSIQESHFSLEDLCVSGDSTANVNGVLTSTGPAYIIGVIVHDLVTTGTVFVKRCFQFTGTEVYAINCMAVNNPSGPSSTQGQGFLQSNVTNGYYYNCTVHNCGFYGMHRNLGTMTTTNCVVSSTPSNGCFSGTQTQSYNCSSDATASGTGSRTSQTVTYLDSGSPGDFHLDPADAGARGFGTDLSGDANYPFDDDIDYVTISTWSMGADSDGVGAGGGNGATNMLLIKRRRR